MDLDSDYCSNDSDGIQSSSRTPTPPNHTFSKCPVQTNDLLCKQSKSCEDGQTQKDSVVFIVGLSQERLEIHNASAIMWKAPVLKSQILNAQSTGGIIEIKLIEWDPQMFKVLLKYLETDVFKASELTNYIELVRLCVAYDVPKLLAQICPLVKQKLTLDNCVEVYKLAATKDIEDLRVAAYNYFLRMGNAFLEHSTFLDLDCITLSILISSDDFSIVEITLFNRLKDWVTQECKRLNYPADRKEFFGRVAGLLFEHVRYAQMTPKEFRNEVLSSGLLSKKDIECINLRHRTHPGLWYMLPPCQFVDRPRMSSAKLQFAVPLYNNVQLGFRKIAGASPIIQESVRFMVTHDIFLTSIGFFGPAKSDRFANGCPLTAYTIKILVEGDYSKYHCRCPAQNATIITRENFSIDLNQPIRIKKLEPHKLTVWIDGEVTQFGVWALPQAVVLIQDKGELITFHFGDADSDPQPVLDSTGVPSSSTPTLVQQQHHFNNRQQFKQEPRMSGVIRCISFVIRDR